MEAIKALRENREDIVRTATVPAIAISALHVMPAKNTFFGWMFAGMSFPIYIVLAVGVHRVILLSESSENESSIHNYARFVIWSIAVVSLFLVIFLPFAAFGGYWFYLIIVLVVPALYVSARASLILPNRAVGELVPFEKTWKWSEGNGWQLLGALFVPPFVLDILISLFTSWMNEVARDLSVAVLSIPVVVIEVAVLSVAYRDLRARYETA